MHGAFLSTSHEMATWRDPSQVLSGSRVRRPGVTHMDYLILSRIVDEDYLTRQGLRIRCLPDSACQTQSLDHVRLKDAPFFPFQSISTLYNV